MFGYRVGHSQADLSFDQRDNARYAPLAKVIDTAFTWGDDRAAAHAVAKNADLRIARQGFHQAASRCARTVSRNVTPAWVPNR